LTFLKIDRLPPISVPFVSVSVGYILRLMHVTVHVPSSPRQFTAGASKLHVEVVRQLTLAELFRCLHGDHPGIVERTLDEQGRVREHVNVFVDGESIRAGSSLGLKTAVRAGAEVWILPAVSGGS
jgi:molybdopterin converting factor small subunit